MAQDQLHKIRRGASNADDTPSPANTSFLVLAILLIVGAALLLLVARKVFTKDTVPYVFFEHLGSALVVSSVIGFTYEWIVHKRREALLRAFAQDQMEATSQALDAFVATTPNEVFNLLEDIAIRVGDKIPTLYTPAREEESEYTFSSSLDYFTDLIAARRGEVVSVLRNWIKESSHRNLKYLASDFIGYFKLVELRDEIKSAVRWSDWQTISWETKACRLNYLWAASRADPRGMYKDLAVVMRNTPFDDVQSWVLFIPRQMKDRELLTVIDQYLERDDLSHKQLSWVIPALAELWEVDEKGVREILKQHRKKFSNEPMVNEINRVWRMYSLAPDRVVKLVRYSSSPQDQAGSQ